ncbi:MAG: enolase C-terminal domain-like protein [Bdellovibrionia bacterium]
MRIFYSPYELKPRTSLSSQASADARPGALLKIEHDDLGTGYADLFPWPELGDQPLADQLAMLQSGLFTSLSRNSFVFTRADARARAEKKSLWEGLAIPKNHKLITDAASLLTGDLLDKILSEEFERIKLKLGREPKSDADHVNKIAKKLNGKAKLRLDFNSSLTKSNWQTFCETLSAEAVNAIDFIEDPIEWDAKEGFGPSPRQLKLAVDRSSDTVIDSTTCPDVIIIKPAVSDVASSLVKAKNWHKRIVFTSYLDHPVGQLWAAWSAATAAKETAVDICGLLSQDAYEPNSFQSLIMTEGPKLVPPHGTGIGWDAELESLCEWKELP